MKVEKSVALENLSESFSKSPEHYNVIAKSCFHDLPLDDSELYIFHFSLNSQEFIN